MGSFRRVIRDYSDPESISVNEGDIVCVTESQEHWCYVTLVVDPSITGWVSESCLSPITLPRLTAGQSVCFAVADYRGDQGDLTFSAGDLILISDTIDEHWSKGFVISESNGKTITKAGVFPNNHTMPLTDDTVDLNNSTASSNVGYGSSLKTAVLHTQLVAQLPDELDLDKNEKVQILEENVDDMWCRIQTSDGRVGLCPQAFLIIDDNDGGQNQSSLYPALNLSVNTSSSSATYRNTSASSGLAGNQARVLYDFNAEAEGDLSIRTGDTVTVIEHVDADWTKGTLNGRTGIFPRSFIELSEDANVRTSSISPANLTSLARADLSTSPGRPAERREVLFDFVAQQPGDLTAFQGDIVEVEHWENADWVRARNTNSGESGAIPSNFLSAELGRSNRTSTATDFGNSSSSSDTMAKSMSNTMATYQNVGSPTNSITTSNTPWLPQPSTGPKPTIPQLGQASSTNTPFDTAWSLGGNNAATKSAAPARPAPPDLSRVSSPPQENGFSNSVYPNLSTESTKLNFNDAASSAASSDARSRVLGELVSSEQAYGRDISLVMTCLQQDRSTAINVPVLLAGLDDIAKLSSRLLNDLQTEMSKPAHQALIGAVFVRKKDELQAIYDTYWPCSDVTQSLLQQYEGNKKAREALKECVRRMQDAGSNCLDINVALTRPVQRLLKYPLFIEQLIKMTELGHPDYEYLNTALRIMSGLAQNINETKRQKELVLKYRSQAAPTVPDRLSKLNLHSVKKKSSRFGVRFTSSIGLKHLPRDEEFSRLECEYRGVQKAIQDLMRDARMYCAKQRACVQMQTVLVMELASTMPDAHRPFLNQYQNALDHISKDAMPAYFSNVQKRVHFPLESLSFAFTGPDLLIEKRMDKLLDYEAALGRTKEGNAKLSDSERLAKAEYEALNKQLNMELPSLIDKCVNVLNLAIRAFAQCRHVFVEQQRHALAAVENVNIENGMEANTKQMLCGLFDKNFSALITENESLRPKHMKLLEKSTQMMITSVSAADSQSGAGMTSQGSSSKLGGWKPFGGSKKGDQGGSRRKHKTHSQLSNSDSGNLGDQYAGVGGDTMAFASKQKDQSAQDRDILRRKFQPERLFDVVAKPDEIDFNRYDLDVNVGDLVAMILNKDPTGDTSRWFDAQYVENGVSHGFVPADCLVPMGSVGDVRLRTSTSTSSAGRSKLIDVQSPNGNKPVSLAPPSNQPNRQAPTKPASNAARPTSTIDDLLDLNFSAPAPSGGSLFNDMDPFSVSQPASITTAGSSLFDSDDAWSSFGQQRQQQQPAFPPQQQQQQFSPLNFGNVSQPLNPINPNSGNNSYNFNKAVVDDRFEIDNPIDWGSSSTSNNNNNIFGSSSRNTNNTSLDTPKQRTKTNSFEDSFEMFSRERAAPVPPAPPAATTAATTPFSRPLPTPPVVNRPPPMPPVVHHEHLQKSPQVSPRPPPPAPVVPQRPTYTNWDEEFGAKTEQTPRIERQTSTLSTGRRAPLPPQNAQSVAQPKEKSPDVESYAAEFDYTADDPVNQLSLFEGQVVLVHQKCDMEGNSEWWYVQDEHNEMGYVPANYLKPVDS